MNGRLAFTAEGNLQLTEFKFMSKVVQSSKTNKGKNLILLSKG